MNVKRSSSSIESARSSSGGRVRRSERSALLSQPFEVRERDHGSAPRRRPSRAVPRPRRTRRRIPSARGRTARPAVSCSRRSARRRRRRGRARNRTATTRGWCARRWRTNRPCGCRVRAGRSRSRRRPRRLPPTRPPATPLSPRQVRGTGARGGDRVPPQIRDRPGAGHFHLIINRRNEDAGSTNTLVLH